MFTTPHVYSAVAKDDATNLARTSRPSPPPAMSFTRGVIATFGYNLERLQVDYIDVLPCNLFFNS